MAFRETTLGLLAGLAFCATAQAADIDHVLLISVDGLHALDVARYVEGHPNSALAELSSHGITYSNARTPANLRLVSGPAGAGDRRLAISHGLFYDVSYDRTLFDPSNTTCQGSAGQYDRVRRKHRPIQRDNVSLNVIDPTQVAARTERSSASALPVYPHNAIRTNTIFEVVKSKGGRTAWADKHPAYDLVNGPSGKGVDDLYTPEITNVNGFDATVSVDCTVANDQLKVTAIINEINGLNHDGTPGGGAPAVFGMNFQAVSVGQKLANDNSDGSCPQSTATLASRAATSTAPDADRVLAYGLQKTDEALGSMIQALKQRGTLSVHAVHRQRQAWPVADQPGQGQQAGPFRRPRRRIAGRRNESGARRPSPAPTPAPRAPAASCRMTTLR